MGIPYGLNKNPNTNASIPSDISFCINDPIAATIHISIKKYRVIGQKVCVTNPNKLENL